MEAKKYPIFASMYHPEAKLYPVSNPTTRDTTDEIAFRFSLLLNRWARKNDNRVSNFKIISEMAVERVPS
jgi:hypothetical protein